MATSIATRRLRREYTAILKSPIPNVTATPLEANILEWHFVIAGTEGTPYENGHYHGKLKFPADYPLRPPSVMMCTPSGRFKTNRRLCLSMSDFHPESWNPMWSVSTILTGLYSFMLENAPTLGSMEGTVSERQRLAKISLAFNVRDETFRRLFPELIELHDSRSPSDAAADVTEPRPPTQKTDEEDDMGDLDAQPSALVFTACVGLTIAILALVASSLVSN